MGSETYSIPNNGTRIDSIGNRRGLNATVVSAMHFVDLAGSERNTIDHVTEKDVQLRFKEVQSRAFSIRYKDSLKGCHINRSLLTLGTVIRALSDPTVRTLIIDRS